MVNEVTITTRGDSRCVRGAKTRRERARDRLNNERIDTSTRRDATRREPTIRADATARHPLCIEHHFSPSFIHPFTDYTGRYPRFDELFASRVYFAVTGEQPASRGLLRKTSL